MRQITEYQWLSAIFSRCLQCVLEAWRHLADDQIRHDIAASRQASISTAWSAADRRCLDFAVVFLANERNSAERAEVQIRQTSPEPWQATFPTRWVRSTVR